ncbi:hypothetical protein Bbelb_265550 [Branchiostoma belcheri]|nr:hypothetical protein Bbelb_265550 [Branchiostoma belcheri]
MAALGTNPPAGHQTSHTATFAANDTYFLMGSRRKRVFGGSVFRVSEQPGEELSSTVSSDLLARTTPCLTGHHYDVGWRLVCDVICVTGLSFGLTFGLSDNGGLTGAHLGGGSGAGGRSAEARGQGEPLTRDAEVVKRCSGLV